MTEKSFFSWNRKSEHHHQVLRIRNSLGTKFQLKPTFLISCNKFAQNGNFRSKKTEKVNAIIEFCLFEILAHVINYRFTITHNQKEFNILYKIFSKSVFRKHKHCHRILHNPISLGTKVKLKLTMLIFWTKFAQIRYFRSKAKKVNTTIKCWIIQLV